MSLTTKNKIGIGLAIALSIVDLPSLLQAPDPGETGPPTGILVVSTACGVVTLVSAIIAWRRGSDVALRVTAGGRVLSMLTALPAFFVDIPAAVKALAALFTILTIVSVVLMLSPARRSASVTD